MPTEQQYWEALQAKICLKCLEGGGKGGCRIAYADECAVTRYLPQIIEVVNSVYSPSVEPYEAQLRNKVCGVCIHQSPTGDCAFRTDVECALDRYFPLIVQVIEETQLKERFGRK